MLRLPPDLDFARFDALHDDAAAWRHIIADIAAEHSQAPVVQALDGTVLVGLCGRDLVVKLYPPFLRDHFAFERAALVHFHNKLSVPTPELVASGERDGWPLLVMTQLHGEPLSRAWPALQEDSRLALLEAIGLLCAEAHALPCDELVPFAPRWDDFICAQRAGCVARQRRTGLPAHLLADVERFVAGPIPGGAHTALTGEYTPMNLFVDARGLCGMYDFGDGMIGPGAYDWLGPMNFLAAGRRERHAAFLAGYGAAMDDEARLGLMRLSLLHRYSNLKAQVAMDGWQDAADLEALAARIWP